MNGFYLTLFTFSVVMYERKKKVLFLIMIGKREEEGRKKDKRKKVKEREIKKKKGRKI